jgi:hypothetical protein
VDVIDARDSSEAKSDGSRCNSLERHKTVSVVDLHRSGFTSRASVYDGVRPESTRFSTRSLDVSQASCFEKNDHRPQAVLDREHLVRACNVNSVNEFASTLNSRSCGDVTMPEDRIE